MTLTLVMLGAALGAALRFGASTLLPTVDQGFPVNTLLVNLIGAMLIGLAWGLWRDEPWFFNWGRAFVLIGFLGGFTTFSALALETVQLIEAGRGWIAAGYVLLTTILGILCTLFSYLAVREI